MEGNVLRGAIKQYTHDVVWTLKRKKLHGLRELMLSTAKWYQDENGHWQKLTQPQVDTQAETIPRARFFESVKHKYERLTDEQARYVEQYEKETRKPPKRGAITAWTYPARKRFKLVLRNGIEAMEAEFVLTLPGKDFSKDGREIKAWLDVLESHFRRKGIEWVWIQEWQKRDAWHGHFAVSKWVDEAWLRRTWYQIVGSGQPDHLMWCLGGNSEHGKGVRRIGSKRYYGAYLQKYMGKDLEKVVPDDFVNPGRFSGWSAGFVRIIEKYFNPDEGLGKLFVRYARKHRKAEMRSWSTSSRFKKKKTLLPGARRFRPGEVGFVHYHGAGYVEAFARIFRPDFLTVA